MRQYSISDFIFKVKYKTTDHLLRFKWIFLLGSLGKGSFIRSRVRIIGNSKRIYIGERFKIYQNTIIAIGKGEIKIGNDGLIAVGSYINCGNEKLIIGDKVTIGSHCKIFTYSHHYSDDNDSISEYRNGNVVIGDNVFIGANSVILPNVTIGNNVVIGASSVVTQDIPPNYIVAGIPAKMIKIKTSHINNL